MLGRELAVQPFWDIRPLNMALSIGVRARLPLLTKPSSRINRRTRKRPMVTPLRAACPDAATASRAPTLVEQLVELAA